MRGDGTIYKRGNIFWLRYYRNGKLITLSSGTDNERKARASLKKEVHYSRSQQRWLYPAQRSVTTEKIVLKLLDHYRAIGKERFGAYAQAAWKNHLSPVFGSLLAADITSYDCDKYRTSRTAEGAAQATVNRELAVLRRACVLAKRDRVIPELPYIPLVQERNARQVFLTAEQVIAIRSSAAEESLGVRIVIELAYVYGWRKSELLSLRAPGGVDLASGVLRLEHTKSGKPREVPVVPPLRGPLEALVATHPVGERLFPKEKAFDRAWKRICKRAGISGIVFHDFRRTSARVKRSLGVDSSVIMAIQGWETDAMFRRYAITDREDMTDALSRVQ